MTVALPAAAAPAARSPDTRQDPAAEDAGLDSESHTSPAGPAATISSTPTDSVVIRQLSLVYPAADQPVVALSDIDLVIRRGEFVSFIGPSGCGKTTLMRVIADLATPTSGHIRVNGLTPTAAREARAYGYVFQAPALLAWRNVLRNVTLPLEIMGVPKAEARARALRWLATVNLEGFEKKFPWQLSGGMQQRVSIARALAFDPQLLLMDEPFGALDEITRDHLNEQLRLLWAQTGKTVVFVTHSISEAVYLSSRIVVMSPRPGRILEVIDNTHLPAERALDVRETPAFLEVAHRVRVALRAGHSYGD
jgi:NitT/TauT family transport system ATP-binding protein